MDNTYTLEQALEVVKNNYERIVKNGLTDKPITAALHSAFEYVYEYIFIRKMVVAVHAYVEADLKESK